MVGTNLKTLEVSAEKASKRQEAYETQIEKMEKKLEEAIHRAEFAERSVAKLQCEVDRLEGEFASSAIPRRTHSLPTEELIEETESYKRTVSELDETLSELTSR